MAKSSQLEDYWHQYNIEGLFKELTHILVQRMPPDPAVALVQHLQKKFPRSFKSSLDTNDNIGIISKTMTNNLQLQSITSPRSDVNREGTDDLQMQRRVYNQNQVTIATGGSAFTDLFKQNTNTLESTPEVSLKNIVAANRISKQAVKMGKDIQSDRDILEEELIKPLKPKGNVSSTTLISSDLLSEDLPNSQSYEEPSVRQIVKYKEEIRNVNDRRIHRQKLAEIAAQERNKEQFFQPELSTKRTDDQRQTDPNRLDEGYSVSQVVPVTSSGQLTQKPMYRSKEEEEILDDENIFEPRRQRPKERYKTTKASTSRSNTPYTGDTALLMRRGTENAMPSMQFIICKVCGNEMNIDDNQVSAQSTARSFEPQPSNRSVGAASDIVDDWFESASEVSSPRKVLPWTQDIITPSPIDSNPFQQNRFQPITDTRTNTAKERQSTVPLIITDDKIKGQKSTTPRMSESDVFVRTPEPKLRRSSSSRSVPSPVTKKHQTDTLTVPSNPLTRTIANPSLLTSTLTATMFPSTERRMSGWSVCEHSPDDSD